jgi:hypothetical protein
VSRGKIRLSLAVAVIFFLAFYVRRDMGLKPDLTLEALPDVSVENLDFRRVIGSREWHLKASRAEHDEGLIKAFLMEIDVTEPESGKGMRLNAARGEFAEKAEKNYSLEARSLDGILLLDGRSMDFLAPSANYERSTDIWSFNEGIELWDDESLIKGGAAVIDSNGVLAIRKGAYASWTTE